MKKDVLNKRIFGWNSQKFLPPFDAQIRPKSQEVSLGSALDPEKTNTWNSMIREISNRTHGQRTPKKPEYLIARSQLA